MSRAPLELIGKPLFSHEPLAGYLESELREQVKLVYATKRTRRYTKLQLRRAFDSAAFPPPLTMVPGSSISVLGEAEDGRRLVAEHRSVITGEAGYFEYAPSPGVSERLPVATVENGELLITVLFDTRDRRFVPPLIRAELDVIQAVLASQCTVLDKIRRTMATIVRRVVAEEWPALTGPVASRKPLVLDLS